jgi:hypothetical protein
MDRDFKFQFDCAGRGWMSAPRRWFADAVCRLTGHLLHRVLTSTVRPKDHSLDHYATYCRRCFRGGYVEGDYRQPALSLEDVERHVSTYIAKSLARNESGLAAELRRTFP